MLLSTVSLRGGLTRLQAAAAAGHPLHAANSVLASDWFRGSSSELLLVEESHAAPVSQGTAAAFAAAFDLHWENQSGIKDRRETGNTFLLATAWQQHTAATTRRRNHFGPRCNVMCTRSMKPEL